MIMIYCAVAIIYSAIVWFSTLWGRGSH